MNQVPRPQYLTLGPHSQPGSQEESFRAAPQRLL
jgi:hypothetical protein